MTLFHFNPKFYDKYIVKLKFVFPNKIRMKILILNKQTTSLFKYSYGITNPKKLATVKGIMGHWNSWGLGVTFTWEIFVRGRKGEY